MLGTIGNLLILTAFVASIVSGLAYLTAARKPHEGASWLRTGRLAWLVMLVTAIGASVILSNLIFTHQFQYNYVWSNSSRDLPARYLFSAFWAGQEGSFLLWILFSGLMGYLAARWAHDFEAHIMSIIGLSQAFMISMVVGIDFGAFTIGSSPFMLLAERFPDATFLAAGGVPPDGNGLNDLLQNYWMVIHPPTLFLGFAAMVVPFAYAVAGLWRRQYTQWVRPALPWALAATLILLLGITLGGYWAYVTLSFGGYWAWDPVENSSFVPMLIGAAAVHTMIAQKKSGSSHKAAILLSILAFMTVIYSTFLTRSGILGDVSVHSFVDLGLYNQLLIWILTVALVGFGLFAYRYRELPAPQREPRVMSREFMIFTGAMVLAAIAAVVLLGTSTPIIGQIFRDNPSGVPMEFYNKWTLPMAAVLALLVGVGQLFWWTRMSIDTLNRLVAKPLALAVISTAVVLFATPFAEATAGASGGTETAAVMTRISEGVQAGILANLNTFWSQYGTGLLLLLLVFCSFFALYGNGMVLWKVGRGNPKLAGGAIAHVGLAFALLGIVTSSGMNDPVVDPRVTDRENFVVERGQTRFVDGYQVTYRGTDLTPEGYTEYLLDIRDRKNRTFSLAPVVYKSRNEQWIQHPAIKHYVEHDLFVAVSPQAMFGEQQSSDSRQFRLRRNESVTISGTPYSMRFEQFMLQSDSAHTNEPEMEIVVAAKITVTDAESGETRSVLPVYMIDNNRRQQFVPATVEDWGFTLSFVGMSVDDGSISVLVDGLGEAAPDWIVVQAYRKPFINLLWFGLFLLTIGFGMSIYRRVNENRFEQRRVPRTDNR